MPITAHETTSFIKVSHYFKGAIRHLQYLAYRPNAW